MMLPCSACGLAKPMSMIQKTSLLLTIFYARYLRLINVNSYMPGLKLSPKFGTAYVY